MSNETDLPEPLVPSNVDLRDAPFPWKELAAAFAAQFGIPVDVAEAEFKNGARRMGYRIQGEEH